MEIIDNGKLMTEEEYRKIKTEEKNPKSPAKPQDKLTGATDKINITTFFYVACRR